MPYRKGLNPTKIMQKKGYIYEKASIFAIKTYI